MIETGRIYIIGAGAIGLPLAAYLASDGRSVVAVRTSRNDVSKDTITISVRNNVDNLKVSVETVSLSKCIDAFSTEPAKRLQKMTLHFVRSPRHRWE